MNRNTNQQPAAAVTVIIPVFRNLEISRACLESVICSQLPDNASVLIINDHSPEAELEALCEDVARREGLELAVNEENLGFVKTANRGFALAGESDIILLNSDTIVSADWVSRLQACAYSQPDTGTVTPFSNNGTICSYPVFPLSNDLPAGWSQPDLDQIFKTTNSGLYAYIPTAVGFCMYIKRQCLLETGSFDEDNFGLGYGEECDFSLRASVSGWKHVVAADVFVYHEGAASFATESQQRKQHADKIMNNMHPGYHGLITDFIESDPIQNLRNNIDMARLACRPADSTHVLLERSRYAKSLIERATEYRRTMLKEQAHKLALEKMLQECRTSFDETDRALLSAEKVVSSLNGEIDKANIYAQHLRDHIANMEHSRSWRYTAWLRRKG